MELVYLIGFGFLCIVLRMFYEEKEQRRRLEIRLLNQFGKAPDGSITTEKLRSIQQYYNSTYDSRTDIDDITWNDLDMNEIYLLLNNTCTSIGEEYLYAMLRKLNFERTKLEQVDKLSDYFMKDAKQRVRIQMLLSRIGRTSKISVYEYINALDAVKQESIVVHILQAFAMCLAPCVIFLHVPTGIFLTLGVIAMNMVTYFQSKQKMEPYLNIVTYISKMLTCTHELEKMNVDELEPMMSELSRCSKKIKEFQRGANIIGAGSGGLLDVIMDYVRMLFHIDIIQFHRLIRIFGRNKAELVSMYEVLGNIDSCIAVASFRRMLNYYTKPEFVEGKQPVMEVLEVFHPLITEPVVNSVYSTSSILITGSNASGKSTFLKTIALNAILSQTIYTSLSKRYKASYFYVASSMALRDDLRNKESYYIVEIKSLKRILDRCDAKVPMLCFVDEVLRGTNTLERIAASSEILCSLAAANVICIAATHDIELTHILEEKYRNYHFQEQIVDNNIVFDYKLYEGRALSKNAIRLLGMIGYSEAIIRKATNAADHFESYGEWKKIERR